MPSRPDIECPGDMIIIVCVVNTNSENPQLSWRATHPEISGSEEVTYNLSSALGTTEIGFIARITLREFRNVTTLDSFIESAFEITLSEERSLDQLLLECSSENLGNSSLNLRVNSSGRQNLLRRVHQISFL